MPVTPTYPGVYIEELPSGVRTIVGVATSITAFIGRALRGPTNRATRIQSPGDYERVFGGLWTESTMSYAVQQFFLHGGTDAIIVRLARDAVPATFDVGGLQLEAATRDEANPGTWGNNLHAEIDTVVADDAPANTFNLTIQLLNQPALPGSPGSTVVATEKFRNVSTDVTSSRYVAAVLAQQSQFARATAVPGAPITGDAMFTGGDDGSELQPGDYSGGLGMKAAKQGIYALEDADLFNLLCIPPRTPSADIELDVLREALGYCQDRRAMLIVDPRVAWSDISQIENEPNGLNSLRAAIGGTASVINAVAYFPRLRMPNPLRDNRLETFVPCGAVAGAIARTDATRGVWKAPAGIDVSLAVPELSYRLTDGENGRLNPLGLNCLRYIPPYGNIVWGARTLAGDDRIASEWKYIPVRRTALYIEESLYRGLHWVVFEPNDEALWAQIRLNVVNFMQVLFRQGAFQGTTPRQAFLVKCDRETNPQDQIDLGIVTVLVGFAPLKPAEFVIVQIQQKTAEAA